MSDEYRDQQRKRRLAEREEITARAIALWQEKTRRFAQHTLERSDMTVREELRRQAVDAFEAMLDAVHCERGALLLLDASENDAPKKLPPPAGKNTPKDPA